MSYFQTKQIDDKTTITADEGLAKWKADREVNRLAEGDYEPISKLVWDRLNDAVTVAGFVRATGQSKAEKQAAEKANKNVTKALAKHEARFLKYFSDGLAAGKKQLLASLDSLINDQSRLQNLAPGADLKNIMVTVRKRRDFLKRE
jgi:hypothetical protein